MVVELAEPFCYFLAPSDVLGFMDCPEGTLLTPELGYPGMISVPGDWYSWCVDYQMGFMGLEVGWITSCFDLSAYIGEDVVLTFEFGSDDTFVEAGWYIASVKVGNTNSVATENRTWDEIKGIFR